MVISIAANLRWPLYQLDVKNAFFHGDLNKEVYMSLPPRFVCKGEQQKKCRLKKSLYGLKLFPRAWFQKFSGTLLSISFRQCNSDYSVFVKRGG